MAKWLDWLKKVIEKCRPRMSLLKVRSAFKSKLKCSEGQGKVLDGLPRPLRLMAGAGIGLRGMCPVRVVA